MPYLPTPADLAAIADADAHTIGDVVARDEVSVRSLTYAQLVRDVADALGAAFAAEISALPQDARRVHVAEAAFCALGDEITFADVLLSGFVDDVDAAVSEVLAAC